MRAPPLAPVVSEAPVERLPSSVVPGERADADAWAVPGARGPPTSSGISPLRCTPSRSVRPSLDGQGNER